MTTVHDVDAPPLPPELALEKPPIDDESLDWFMAQDEATQEGVTEISGFVIDDDDVAEWAMRKYAEAQARVSLTNARAAAWHERIANWEADEKKRASQDLSFFGQRLEDYMARRREASKHTKKNGEVDYRTKSIPLPSGTIGSKRKAASLKVVDDDVVIAAVAEQLPDVTVTKTQVMISLLSPHVVTKKIHVRYECLLDCGHTMTLPVVTQDGEPVEMPERVECLGCLEVHDIVQAEDGHEYRAYLCVPDPDGVNPDKLVPLQGVGVEPEGVTYSIKPA